MSTTHKNIILAAGALLLVMGQGCQLPGQNLFSNKKTVPNNDGGMYRSDNHGLTWKHIVSVTGTKTSFSLKDATTRTVVFDPRDPDHLYVGTRENGVWYSKNSGDSWQSTSIQSGDVPCIVFYPTDPDIMYASLGTTVRKSINAGLTWASVYSDGQGQAVNCVAIDKNAPDTVWATTSGGKILKSLDAGQTWTIALNMPSMTPRRIVFDQTDQTKMTIFTKTKGIFTVNLANNNWQDISGPLKKLSGATTINGVAVINSQVVTWIMATKYGLIESFDQGSTWSTIPTLVNPGSVGIQNISVNPRDPQEMFITIGQKLHHTLDAGQTWTIVSLPTSRLPIELKFDPVRIDRLYVGTFRETQ